MSRSSIIALSCCLAILTLSSCNRGTDDPRVEEPVIDLADTLPGTDSASMRYACEGGYGVAIMGDIARVSTQDGRAIDLRRVADSSPPLFAGEALEFSVESDGAVLGQDEGGRFGCQEAD